MTRETSFSETSSLKPTNLLKSRKTCERRQLNITELVKVNQSLISFGQFLSGKTLGNKLQLTNKTAKDQTFIVCIDDTETYFTETTHALLAPFKPEDLPFSVSAKESKRAVNSQNKFKCFFIENPMTRTLQKSVVIQMAGGES